MCRQVCSRNGSGRQEEVVAVGMVEEKFTWQQGYVSEEKGMKCMLQVRAWQHMKLVWGHGGGRKQKGWCHAAQQQQCPNQPAMSGRKVKCHNKHMRVCLSSSPPCSCLSHACFCFVFKVKHTGRTKCHRNNPNFPVLNKTYTK